MADRTYIKLFRKMLDWEWYKDANTFRVFMHILLKANYKPSTYMGHTIGAGECVFGRKKCAEELGISERQVRTALKHLKSTNEVTIRTTNKFSIIHIVKWEFWQIADGQETNKTTDSESNKRPASDQQVTTSKESKNSKNIRNYYSYTERAMTKAEEEAFLKEVVNDDIGSDKDSQPGRIS